MSDVFYFEVNDEDLLPIRPGTEAGGTGTSDSLPATVCFEFGEHEITPGWAAFLEQTVDVLLKNSGIRIYIQGHTDNAGSTMHNRILSEKRAEAVYQYLLNKGVSADRMERIRYGDTWPKVSNLTPEGSAINRRVEILVAE